MTVRFGTTIPPLGGGNGTQLSRFWGSWYNVRVGGRLHVRSAVPVGSL